MSVHPASLSLPFSSSPMTTVTLGWDKLPDSRALFTRARTSFSLMVVRSSVSTFGAVRMKLSSSRTSCRADS